MPVALPDDFMRLGGRTDSAAGGAHSLACSSAHLIYNETDARRIEENELARMSALYDGRTDGGAAAAPF